MVFQLQRKLAFESLSGRNDASMNSFLQHAAIPVVGAHHPKENAILKEAEDDTGETLGAKTLAQPQMKDLRPACAWRSRSETSPCGRSSRCSPECLEAEDEREGESRSVFLHRCPPFLPDPQDQMRSHQFSRSDPRWQTGLVLDLSCPPAPLRSSRPQQFKGGIAFQPPSAHVPVTSVSAAWPLPGLMWVLHMHNLTENCGIT